MNGRKAKLLRRIAEMRSVGREKTVYAKNFKFGYNYAPTQCRVMAGCTRSIYQNLKRAGFQITPNMVAMVSSK